MGFRRMNETTSVLREFFQMPNEAKQQVYTEEFSKSCILFTSSISYANEKVHLWRDFLKHPCHPLPKWQHFWPQTRTRYQEIVGACSVEVKKLASRILGLISEGLGLKSGYFEDELSGRVIMTALHYPPCPEPSLTLGTSEHVDADVITILLQDEVKGLQILNEDEDKWIGVDPIPHAFVVNIGALLQVIRNNKLKSAKHTVVTNKSRFRTPVAFFVTALEDSVIEPAHVDQVDAPDAIYKPFTAKDYIFSPETRPGNLHVPIEVIPVIDLSEAEQGDRTPTIQKILKAAQEFGFFQVINHGVSQNLMSEAIGVFGELFQRSNEGNQKLGSEDVSKRCRLRTCSTNCSPDKVHLWRDFLLHSCHPLKKWQHTWPQHPTRYQ